MSRFTIKKRVNRNMDRDLIPLQSEVEERSVTLHSPWFFVSTLYFAAGVPYIIVNSVSVVLYKKLGIDNAQIAFWTSFLYLPWVIKMAWGPLIDIYSTKRNWILYTQFAMAVCLGCLAFSLQFPNFFVVSLLVLAIAAFISATQDTAIDGFYMLALDQNAQAFFVGIRSTFYRIAMIFGLGLLVFLAGRLEISLQDSSLGWSIAFSLSALVFVILLIFHWRFLPFPKNDSEHSTTLSVSKFYDEVIATYFNQEKIWAILAFIFL